MNALNPHPLNRCSVFQPERRAVDSAAPFQRFNGSTIQRLNVSTLQRSSGSPFQRSAFTLVELILVLALLVIATSLAVPALANFVRGRALDSEARRLAALMHAGQSRAVSEGMNMMIWFDEKGGGYGLESEVSGINGDAKAENLTVDSTLVLAVQNGSLGATLTFKNRPAIRFLADGTVDEGSPQGLKLTDSAGFARSLGLNSGRTGYEIRDSH